ncbi:cupin domain-containing protein [Bacteroides fragilis]|uniref:cupin domain-containing protein n=1 Tax=Bacteroides fragilis TaxID=817 RepID=UPI000FF6CBEB|nr:cupin domain-containing protein [Bacteroides fragilis]MBA4500348.1 cupin domain-containing protein [Bacteroides fragilis]MCS2321114.1 cupin domain-containing protein [Bacteroides fragilis]MCZ2578451.1 cupin domain-containing protein [Bacteroides fragilis]MCZ2645962.1 cupin domain-containing protein [Bacteroides fragilis]RGZ83029.1 cupin domain-containing protein [Bacteroides fragilis]
MNKIVLFILLIILSCCTSMEKKNVARTNLLSIQLKEKQGLSKVEIKKVVIPINGKAEYHLHPCLVVGHIVSGTLLFQIEGEKPQLIKAGEAFYEPKNKPILHFDNALDSEPLVFMAYYLVEENEDLLMLLPE